MTILDRDGHRIVELAFVDGLEQTEIGERVGVTQSTVSRTLAKFETELVCIIGSTPRTPAFRRDCVLQLLGNARRIIDGATDGNRRVRARDADRRADR